MGEILKTTFPAGTKEPKKTAEQHEPTLADILAEPLDEAEARKLLADVDVQLAQLHAIQIQKNLELDQINAQIAAAQFDKSIIYRRVLNTAPQSEEAK